MLEPVYKRRYRKEWKIIADEWSTCDTGPLIVVDNCLYDSCSTAREARNPDLWISGDNINGPGTFYRIGPLCDLLIPSHQYNPNQETPAEPARLLWNSLGYFDVSRDLHWVSSFQAEMPFWARPPLSTDYPMFPPHPVNGEKVTVECKDMLDTVTENWYECLEEQVSVHNVCFKQKYSTDTPLTYWVPCRKWTPVWPNYPSTEGGYWDMGDRKWLRYDIYGMDLAMFFKHIDGDSTMRNWGLTVSGIEGNVTESSIDYPTEGMLDQYFNVLSSYQLKAIEKANTGVMDLLVTLVELPKTFRLLRGVKGKMRAYKRAVEIIRNRKNSNKDRYLYEALMRNAGIDRGKLSSTKQSVRALSNLWMEYRYGWRLLYYDAKAVWELILTFFKKARRSYTCGSGAALITLSDNTDAVYWGSSGYIISYFANTKLRAGVATAPNVNDTQYKKLYQGAFTGLNSPAASIWDLTKWSWIVDSFFDIGQLLAVIGQDPARFIRAWHTIEVPFDSGYYSVDSSILPVDIKDAVGLETNWHYTSGKDLFDHFFDETENALEITYLHGKCSMYVRIPMDPTWLPLVGLNARTPTGGKIADILSILAR